MNHDLLIRGGNIVTPEGVIPSDVAVSDGLISAIEPEIEGNSTEEIDAAGLHVFPGVVDAHVHLNEPGRTEWEGFDSGTRAFAAGGATTVFDMPLNSFPPTSDGAGLDAKLAAGEGSSFVDFALWGAIQPDNLCQMEELAERGVVGFKAFMSASGTEDFRRADDLTLYEGMVEAARLGLPVAVHAESEGITAALTRRALRELRTSARDYLDSRPPVAELEAISRALLFAEETGCSLHVVHVSVSKGVDLVNAARSRGVDATCETCAHYLTLTEEDVERLGAIAKCAPPLRTSAERDALWEHILTGELPMVTSDHSPCPPEMKSGTDMFRAWGGIAGGQSTLQALLTEGEKRNATPERIAAISATNVAERFGFQQKGRIEVGCDADFALVDLGAKRKLREEDLFYRHRISPYLGREFRGEITRTVVRGTTVFADGRIVSEPIGRFIRPNVERKES